MKQTQQRIEPGKLKPASGEVRKPVLALVGLLVAGLGLGITLYLRQGHTDTSAPQELASAANATEEPVLIEPSAPTNESGQPVVREVKTPTVAPTVSRQVQAAPGPESRPLRPEPSPVTRQLVKSLTDIDLKSGPLTSEKAAEWKQNMQQLVQQGAAAVPAIQEFLEKNEDLRFEQSSGTNLLGEQTLRMSLIKALQNISGPEALGLQTQILQTTADPQEIALLARQLEQQAPEQYRQMAVDAARAVLDMAAGGKLQGRDVGPLFDVLRQYGDANAVADIQRALPNWRYYSAIALADMPNGAGIPALVEMVQNPNSGGRSGRNVALQMLAQVAQQSEVARNTLMEQARGGAIPASSWIEIGSILSGNTFQIGNPAADGISPISGERRYHLAQGEQNFYSRPTQANLSAEEINQRIALVDQLLANNGNELAVDSLQKAKATLQSRLAQPNPTP